MWKGIPAEDTHTYKNKIARKIETLPRRGKGLTTCSLSVWININRDIKTDYNHHLTDFIKAMSGMRIRTLPANLLFKDSKRDKMNGPKYKTAQTSTV